MDENIKKVTAMRDRLIENLLKIQFSRLTGDPVNRLPGTASFVFECIEGESLVLSLDAKGICASSGSACSSASLDHMFCSLSGCRTKSLTAPAPDYKRDNTDEDIDYILAEVPYYRSPARDVTAWEAR